MLDVFYFVQIVGEIVLDFWWLVLEVIVFY